MSAWVYRARGVRRFWNERGVDHPNVRIRESGQRGRHGCDAGRRFQVEDQGSSQGKVEQDFRANIYFATGQSTGRVAHEINFVLERIRELVVETLLDDGAGEWNEGLEEHGSPIDVGRGFDEPFSFEVSRR